MFGVNIGMKKVPKWHVQHMSDVNPEAQYNLLVACPRCAPALLELNEIPRGRVQHRFGVKVEALLSYTPGLTLLSSPCIQPLLCYTPAVVHPSGLTPLPPYSVNKYRSTGCENCASHCVGQLSA